MKRFFIISALLTLVLAAVLLYSYRDRLFYSDRPEFPGADMNKLSGEIEKSDYWAVFTEKDVFCDADGGMDSRIMPYALKMFEESGKHDADWLPRNSWRFGFWNNSGILRFVGVFPAEQMYYSGLTLDEYQRQISPRLFAVR